MKKTVFILICTAAVILALSGCKSPDTESPVSPTTERDMRAELPQAYSIPPDAEYLEVSSELDYVIGTDLSAISEYADAAVCGVVQEVGYISIEGTAFTAISFAVEECYKGDIQKGDLITVLHMGGYIPLEEHIAYFDDAFRFGNLTEAEIKNTVIHELYEAGETEPKPGDRNIYFLNVPFPDSAVPAGAYHRTRGAASLLRVEPGGTEVSRINPEDAPSGERADGAQRYGNEVFSLKEVIDCAASGKTVSKNR